MGPYSQLTTCLGFSLVLVVTVGAITSDNVKASFSNYGAVLDFWYLGVSVTSAWIGSEQATNTLSGTSMAAPGVASLVALHLSWYGNSGPSFLQNWFKDRRIYDVVGAPSGTTNGRAVY